MLRKTAVRQNSDGDVGTGLIVAKQFSVMSVCFRNMRSIAILRIGAFVITGVALLVSVSVPKVGADQTSLVNPEAIDLYFVQQHFADTKPPFETLAALDDSVKASNEFNREDTIQKTINLLRARDKSVKNVRHAVVNLSTALGEYDDKYKEYDLGISDGSYISYNAFGRDIHLALTNGNAATVWALGPKDAEEVLHRNGGSRAVTLILTVTFLQSPPAVDDQPITLNCMIDRYQVLSTTSNIRLGSVVVAKRL